MQGRSLDTYRNKKYEPQNKNLGLQIASRNGFPDLWVLSSARARHSCSVGVGCTVVSPQHKQDPTLHEAVIAALLSSSSASYHSSLF